MYIAEPATLEDEGIILRSGLTPTDMMCIRGDFTLYDAKASRLAVAFLAKSTHHTPEEIPALVYELVEKNFTKTSSAFCWKIVSARQKAMPTQMRSTFWQKNVFVFPKTDRTTLII